LLFNLAWGCLSWGVGKGESQREVRNDAGGEDVVRIVRGGDIGRGGFLKGLGCVKHLKLKKRKGLQKWGGEADLDRKGLYGSHWELQKSLRHEVGGGWGDQGGNHETILRKD